MNGEPFFYTAGVVVPRDVTRLIIDGVKVVEAGIFRGYLNLVWVEIREGAQVIGREAFRYCRNLRRADAPSSLRTIDDHAFWGCSSLSTMNLPEGLRRIRQLAFYEHSFEQISIPSSVAEVGYMAFGMSEVLSKVTLAGGVVMVGRNAFYQCSKLRNIVTSSEVIVVQDGENGSGRATVEKGGTIVLDSRAIQLILTSPYLASMKSDDVERAKDAINRIAGGRPPGEGPLDLAAGGADDLIRVRGGADRIRTRFLGLLSAHRRAIASILERALLPGVAKIILSFLPDVKG